MECVVEYESIKEIWVQLETVHELEGGRGGREQSKAKKSFGTHVINQKLI
jgi:hypothetical protein